MTGLWFSLISIFLIEIGAKTQLLTLDLIKRFNFLFVLISILTAYLINFILAAALAYYLVGFIDIIVIEIGTALSFMIFGLWIWEKNPALKISQENYKNNFFKIFSAYFFLSLADKPQLLALILNLKYSNLKQVFLGYILGIIIAYLVIVIVNNISKKEMPVNLIKKISGSIFIICGLISLWQLRKIMVFETYILICVILAVFLMIYLTKKDFVK